MSFRVRVDGQSQDDAELYETSEASGAAEEAARWLLENGEADKDDFPFLLVVEDSDGHEYHFEIDDDFEATEV